MATAEQHRPPNTEWDAGFEARMKGNKLDSNPYPPFSFKEQHDRWRAGWSDCDEHLTSRDECLRQIGWFG